MGLFSRKSPEEKRKEKFNKALEKSYKTLNVLSPIWEAYNLSANEEEYKKTCECFKEWVSKYVVVQLPKINVWGVEEYWYNFNANYVNSLLAFMVLGQYEEANTYCDKLLEFEDKLLETRINKGVQGGLLTVGKLIAAKAGIGGNKKQQEFIQKIKFIKAICLYDCEKYSEVQTILQDFPKDYGYVFEKDDDYFNQHFKYKDPIFVSNLLK